MDNGGVKVSMAACPRCSLRLADVWALCGGRSVENRPRDCPWNSLRFRNSFDDCTVLGLTIANVPCDNAKGRPQRGIRSVAARPTRSEWHECRPCGIALVFGIILWSQWIKELCTMPL